ncbi:MAG: DUF1800 family protein [Vicinamibacterales bacterium]
MKGHVVLVGAILAGLLGTGALSRAQTTDAAALALESAIQKQLVEGDLNLAITRYGAILDRYGNQRHVAAQALWRLARAQDQLGLPDARQSYERLLREHSDNAALAKAAQLRLTTLMEDEDWIAADLSGTAPVADSWSWPAGAASSQGGNVGQFVIVSDLTLHNPATGQSRRLTDGVRATAYPVLSPTGRSVAYASWSGDLRENIARVAGGQGPGRAAELRIVGIDGTGDRLVTRSPGTGWLRPFAWSPDGRQILTVFERRTGNRQIALVSAEDGAILPLKSLLWLSARDMSFSSDGRFIAYQVSSPVRSRLDLFLLPIEPDIGAERRYSVTLGSQRGAPLTDTDLAIHVLNRLGFGPRIGDIERVKAMGVDAYIAQQLMPERIADPVVDAKLAGFVGLEMDIPQLLEKAGPPVAIAGRRRATIFERPAMAAEAATARTAANGAARTSGDPMVVRAADRPLDTEIHTARMIRAVHSQRQLNEVMVDFWMNHFNVNLGDHQLAPHFEERAIRPYALGKFEDMLRAVARSPQMLSYLDNWRSSAPADVVRQRLEASKTTASVDERLRVLERAPFFEGNKGLNENFARELLELHTMGVDGGYTQQDVIAAAKVLTGWTISSHGLVNGREEDGVFAFDPLMHVDGDKVVLGQTIKSGGVEEGEALLKMLARHPSTARYVSTKLARRFIADDPPRAVIEEAGQTFLRTDGDIREVVRTIFMSPQFRSREAVQAKIKKPFELVASALRAVDAAFEDLQAYGDLLTGNQAPVGRMGEKLYNHEAPDGNPDVGPAWMNSNALLLRLDFANRLAADKVPGIKSNLSSAQTLLTQLGLPKPTPLQIEHTRSMMQAADAAASPAMGGQQNMMMGGAPAGAGTKPQVDSLAVTVAAMLGSPQFQKR